MIEAHQVSEKPDAESPARDFRVTRVFHPSFHVLGLDEAEAWFQNVFGLSSIRLSTAPPADPDNRIDYSTFTLIRELLMDSIDPTLFIKHGKQQYPSIQEPHLKALGWYAEGLLDLYANLRARGFRIVDNLGKEGTDDEPPVALGSTMPMFFTVPEQTGLRYQFLAPMKMAMDPRTADGWSLPPPSPDDPLAIRFTSHHTILTAQPDRALALFIDGLGGSVIHRGRNAIRATGSTYVQLADAVFEFAVPDEGSAAHEDWRRDAPNDTYHAITFLVADLDQARRHLAQVGVGLRTDSNTFLVTDPKTSLGVPWGFTDRPVPGDTRT